MHEVTGSSPVAPTNSTQSNTKGFGWVFFCKARFKACFFVFNSNTVDNRARKWFNLFMENINGSWIFISHSSSDIKKVRLIRNEFEKYGQNPLAFHLKCLTTDTEKGRNELENLIKREIRARDWFVYCESAAAENSEYVTIEREYVRECSKTRIWRINMDDDIVIILEAVRKICCDMQVLLCYSKEDENIALPFADELRKKDYGVWQNVNIEDLQMFGNARRPTEQESFAQGFAQFISPLFGESSNTSQAETYSARNKENGFAIWLYTKNSRNDSKVISEVTSALKHGASLIIYAFDETANLEALQKEYRTRRVYCIPNIPKLQDMYLLTELLESAVQNKLNGVILSQEKVFDTMNKLQVALNYHGNYHPQKPIHIGSTSAALDYCEIYEFPCCGKRVVMGNGEPNQNRADGCRKK